MINLKKFKIALTLLLMIFLLFFVTIPIINASAISETITLEAYSYYKSDDGMGHSWIVVNNNTSRSYNLGVYNMTPGETVTVGLWGNLGNGGVWYNVESYAIAKFGFFPSRVSLQMTISPLDLNKISNYIIEHDYWNISYNCSCFVKDIWNLVSKDTVTCGWLVNLPSWLCDSIRSKSGHFIGKSIKTNSKIGYVYKNMFNYRIPPKLDGSSSSSFALTPMSQIRDSFPVVMSFEEIINAQLKYIGSEFTYEQYMQLVDSNS